jgi:hypothetical protein
MRTRLRNEVVQPRKLFNGIIRYNPAKCAFAAEPVSHLDALATPAWKTAMDSEF